jgi:hypothetical protein
VMESWPCESPVGLIVIDQEAVDDFVFAGVVAISDFMEAGWHHKRLEEYLYVSLETKDIFIDPVALTRASSIGGKVPPETLRREVELAVKRMMPRGTSPNLDRMIAEFLDTKVSAPQNPLLWTHRGVV